MYKQQKKFFYENWVRPLIKKTVYRNLKRYFLANQVKLYFLKTE